MNKRPENEKACLEGTEGEARRPTEAGSQRFIAWPEDESSESTEQLMEEVCEPSNLLRAMREVMANKGSAGTDGMRVEELPRYLQENLSELREQLLSGKYQPQPVRRVEIPKSGGRKRELGIPTVKDRMIQQAILGVLQRRWDKTFSESSYGFRPGRTMHKAIKKAQEYIKEGYSYVVEIDLEKFFDRVNHDMLMSEIAKRVKDKRLLKIIRRFLNSGVVMKDGLVKPTEEGTPQGSPLSPLLSNLFLDKLDKELEKRGHRFVRYADDNNIYVRSLRAAQRVKESVSEFITRKLKLKINEEKSSIGEYQRGKFLGFKFTGGKETPRRSLSPEAIKGFRGRVRELTRRTIGQSIASVVRGLNEYLRGWNNHYGYCETPQALEKLNGWIRRRMRSLIWAQWSHGKKIRQRRLKELGKRGVSGTLAVEIAGSSLGAWRISHTRPMQAAFPNSYFRQIGLHSLNVLMT